MSSVKSERKVLSLVLLVAIVLSMFGGMTMGVSASETEVVLGLSMNGRPVWKSDKIVEWNPVDGAVTYVWEIYRNDTSKGQEPETDTRLERKFTDQTTVDVSEYFVEDGYYYVNVWASEFEEPPLGLYNTRSTIYLHYTKPLVVITPSGGGSSSGGSGGSGSNKADGVANTTSNTATTASVTKPVTKTATDIKTLMNTAKTSGNTVIASKYSGEVTIKADAWKELSGLSFQHDTVAGGKVGVRVTINNPSALAQDMKVSGYVSGTAVASTEKKFDTYFSNEVSVLHFDQTGSWGQEIRVAAKFDLTGMDTTKLTFYSYDKTTGKYLPIVNPNYKIDANGYTHFSTSYAGDIVVSDGSLAKK